MSSHAPETSEAAKFLMWHRRLDAMCESKWSPALRDAQHEQRLSILEALLASPFSANQDSAKATALRFAARDGWLPGVEALIKSGTQAEPDFLVLAANMGQEQVVAYLVDHTSVHTAWHDALARSFNCALGFLVPHVKPDALRTALDVLVVQTLHDNPAAEAHRLDIIARMEARLLRAELPPSDPGRPTAASRARL